MRVVATIVTGGVIIAIALVGVFAELGASEDVVRTEGEATAVATTTTTTSAPPPETLETFLADFSAAFRDGDIDYLVSRLNPAVTDRFGVDQCRTRVMALLDPTSSYTAKSTSEPADFAYTTDGITTVVPGTLTVEVDLVEEGTTSAVSIHLTAVDGLFTWYTDCGTPTG